MKWTVEFIIRDGLTVRVDVTTSQHYADALAQAELQLGAVLRPEVPRRLALLHGVD